MLARVLDRISYWSLFFVIVLLPVFVLPFTNIPIEVAKGLLLVIGLVLTLVFWALSRFFDGKIIIPRSPVLASGLALSLVFLFSAVFSSTPTVSLFGTMLDVGSFWFMFAAFLLMFFSSLIVLQDKSNAQNIFLGVIVVSTVVLFFQVLRVFLPQVLSLGVLQGKMDNVFGSWNALGILAGFTSVISLFLAEFYYISRKIRWFLGALLVLSTTVVALVSFSLVWILLGISALIIFVYKILLYSKREEGQSHARLSDFPAFSLAVMLLSLLFFISGQFIGGYLPSKLGVISIDINPTLKATVTVTKSVISRDPLLGLGPNKFSEAWAKYKPATANNSSFWNTAFSSGSGLIPTLASTTGLLGILALLIFFGLFLNAGFKSFLTTLKHGSNREMTAFFIASLYLFIASFFYPAGPVVFLLAFAFTGVFIGLAATAQDDGVLYYSFLNNPHKGFLSVSLLVLVMIFSAALSFKYIERFASVSHFRSALTAPTISEAEQKISKALSLYTNDLYFRTYSLVYLLKFNSTSAKAPNLSDDEKADLQESFNRAVSGAAAAVVRNKENYVNYKMLGLVYETSAPFSNIETYKNALDAYQKASELNPLNPGIRIDLARVSLASRKIKEAKDYIAQALELKENFVDAHLLASQVSLSENKRSEAITHAEKALSLAPANKDLIKYVDSLKKGNSPSSVPTVENSSE